MATSYLPGGVMECSEQDADPIVRLFEEDCYIDREAVCEAIANRSMFNIIHNEWIIKADFIVRKDDAYHRTEFDRRREIAVAGQPLVIAAPEDLILSKLNWAEESQSELQIRDVRARFRTMMTSRTPEERLRMASRMFSTARELVLSGAGTHEDDAGRRKRLFLRFYARDFSESDCQRILERLTKRSP